MSVDAEIVKIREAIANVHRTFFVLTRELQNITLEVDAKLDGFSSDVHSVEVDVQNIRSGVSHITNKFPSYTIYMAILLALNTILLIVTALLFYRIVQNCRYGTKNSSKIIEDYKHMINPYYIQNYKRKTMDPIEAVVISKRGLLKNQQRYWTANEFESYTDPLISAVQEM